MKATARDYGIEIENRHRQRGEPINEYAEMSDSEIARILTARHGPITRERVRQLRCRAEEKLREALREVAEELYGATR